VSNISHFLDYAEAFESAFVSDDWGEVAECFAPDSEYIAIDGLRAVGRDQIISAFRSSVDVIDRRFDESIVRPLEPQLREDGSLFMTWEIIFKKQGSPDLRVAGTGEATYDGGKISKLVDQLEEGVGETMAACMDEHGSKLG